MDKHVKTKQLSSIIPQIQLSKCFLKGLFAETRGTVFFFSLKARVSLHNLFCNLLVVSYQHVAFISQFQTIHHLFLAMSNPWHKLIMICFKHSRMTCICVIFTPSPAINNVQKELHKGILYDWLSTVWGVISPIEIVIIRNMSMFKAW